MQIRTEYKCVTEDPSQIETFVDRSEAVKYGDGCDCEYEITPITSVL